MKAILGVIAVTVLVVVPAIASAQSSTSGAIAGEVTDTTGAVLPGVTVEAASPVLIEKVRAVVTDDRGQYKIVDLRPGPYSVTFSLPGFSTVKRDGLELNTGVTLPVNVELRVGSVEETITVSSASPVVDVQNVRTQNVLTRAVLDAVPTAKNFQSFAGLTLGAQASNSGSTGGGDNGGSRGEQPTGLTIHGAGVGSTTVDGMTINTMHTVAGTHRYVFNQMQVQEVVLETSGASATSQSGGLNVNMVPKDGGNRFSAGFAGEYTNSDFQGTNLSDELRARGLTRTNSNRKIYDVGVGVGGPIKQDRLWFFTAHRAQRGIETLAGRYFNKLQGTLFYEPDLDRPAFTDSYVRDSGVRFTWQATPKQKIAIGLNLQDYCRCYSMLTGTGGIPVPESTYHYRMYPNNLAQASWSYPATSRLLLEAGYTLRVEHQLDGKPDETGNARPVSDLASGLAYGSLFSGNNTNRSNYGDHGTQGQYNSRFVLSYVTGSHAFKAGYSALHGQSTIAGNPLFNVQYVFRNRVPEQLNQVAWPILQISKVKWDLGIFAQDQWTIHGLTLSLGVRFENLNDYNPAQTRPGGEFTPEMRFEAVHNVPNWKDINPRFSAAYDLFGNGKTALKASVGRYVALHTTDIANRTNPGAAIAALTNRTWNDTNGNYVPDCDLKNRALNGECGPMGNQRFGTTVPQTAYATDVTEGWHVRQYSWQISAGVQHELRPGMALTAAYFRTSHGNFSTTDNLAVTPADYTEYCVTAPADARLPGGGGNRVCGLYDVSVAKFGQVDNLVSPTSKFGERIQVYNGVDTSITARFGRGGMVSGGVSLGHTLTDDCATADFPSQFCRNTLPISGQSQIKVNGAYPLPWGLQASAALQNLPGRALAATYVATNAQILPSLGRNLATCGARVPCTGSATITILKPNTEFKPRYTLLDVRLSKNIRIGRARLQPRIDVYNLLNSAPILDQNTRYGTSWLQPLEIFGARFMKIGAQIDF